MDFKQKMVKSVSKNLASQKSWSGALRECDNVLKEQSVFVNRNQKILSQAICTRAKLGVQLDSLVI